MDTEVKMELKNYEVNHSFMQQQRASRGSQ